MIDKIDTKDFFELPSTMLSNSKMLNIFNY